MERANAYEAQLLSFMGGAKLAIVRQGHHQTGRGGRRSILSTLRRSHTITSPHISYTVKRFKQHGLQFDTPIKHNVGIYYIECELGQLYRVSFRLCKL